MSKKKVKRSLKLNGLDKTLEISKVTMIQKIEPEMIHFDKLDDGTWRIIYSSSTIPDLPSLESIEIIRED